jgi:HEAT repeat protein
LIAGLLGGGAAGLLDGAAAALLTPAPRSSDLSLVLVGFGAGALAGAVLSLLLVGLRALLARAAGRRAVPAAAALLALPVVAYDALAMFGGSRASRIPGRSLLSAVVFLLGMAAVWLLATTLARWIDRVEQGQGPRWPIRSGAALLAGLALGIYAANKLVLPRLYPWFHASCSLALLVAAVLAARLALARPRAAPPRARAVVALLGVAAASTLAGFVLVGRSHLLMFAARERTQLIDFAMRLSPLRPPRRSMRAPPASAAAAAEPLPAGPIRREADVVIITVDALRADHVGAYGYRRATTPNIDALAGRGVRFERAYAQAPHTSFSITSMLTGRYYPTQARLEPGQSTDALASHLRRYSWKTAAFYPEAVFYVEADKLRAFEKTQFAFEYTKVEYLDAHARLSQIAEFFETDRPGRVFLWIHFFEPHEPYERWPDHDFGPGDLDRYDSEIAYTDAAVGRLVSYFDKHRPGTIFVVTADHGEAFDEHGTRYHGSSLYDEQIRVPLIIAVPQVPPAVVAGPVELVDVAPTILGLLDIPVPTLMRGTDLGPWLRDPPAPADRLGHAFAELEDTRMVASASDKLICEIKRDFCAYYDLRTDPGERRNLADANPTRVAALRGELEAWLADQTRLARSAHRSSSGAPVVLERARLGDPAVVSEVAGLLGAENPPPVREEAARLLATTLPPHPPAAPALRACLSAEVPALRNWATVALARLGDPTASAQLGGLLQAAPSPLRLQAALVLAAAGNRAATPALIEDLKACKEVAVCRPIVQALGKLGDRQATPVLIAHLEVVMGRRETVVALGDLGDPAAISPLAERLVVDEYVTVRAAAAESLARIARAGGKVDPAIHSALQSARRREKEPVVRAAVAAALEITGSLDPSPPRSSSGKARSPRPAEGR